MSKKSIFVLACGVVGTLFSCNVQAFPNLPTSKQAVAPAVTLVHDFCGLNFHRNPFGYCVSNGAFYPSPPPTPTQVVAPLGCPWGSGLYLGPDGRCFAPLACPSGHYLGPHGQCFPYWPYWRANM